MLVTNYFYHNYFHIYVIGYFYFKVKIAEEKRVERENEDTRESNRHI